jgi:protein arginine N-methyltransferase 1
LHFKVERAGNAHGIVVWFDTELVDGIGFSNAPDATETIYGSMFFPLKHPVSLSVGQHVCIELEAKLVNDDYVWRWKTEIKSHKEPSLTIAKFDQSQFGGALLSLPRLRRASAEYVPQLSVDGRIHERALRLMNGQTTLEEVARQLATEFPGRFTQWQQALAYAGRLSQEYSQ